MRNIIILLKYKDSLTNDITKFKEIFQKANILF